MPRVYNMRSPKSMLRAGWVRQGTGLTTTGQPTSRFELLESRTELILPIVVLLVAIFLRLYNLDTIPRGLLWDEAHNGLDALRILDGERPIFLTGNLGSAALFVLSKEARAGDMLTVAWYWRLLATDEREFAPGYWPAGTSGISTFEIEVDPDTPTGAYWLQAALYDRRAPEISNLPVFDTEGTQAGNHLRLGPIFRRITSKSAGAR